MVRGLEFGCAATKAEVEVEGCLVWDLVFLDCSGGVKGGGAVRESLLVWRYACAVVDVLGDVVYGLGVVDADCLVGGRRGY